MQSFEEQIGLLPQLEAENFNVSSFSHRYELVFQS